MVSLSYLFFQKLARNNEFLNLRSTFVDSKRANVSVEPLDYAAAGVDIDRSDDVKQRIRAVVESTFTAGARGAFGGAYVAFAVVSVVLMVAAAAVLALVASRTSSRR